MLVLGIAILIWHLRRARPARWALPLLTFGDWRWDAHRELQRLRRARRQTAWKLRVGELSELLKRIAMARHGRSACARLHGQAWLDWLSAQDPDGFDWSQHGQLLIHAPYAPEAREVKPRAVAAEQTSGDGSRELELERLIAATERWVSAPIRLSGPRVDSGSRAIGTASGPAVKRRRVFGARRAPAGTLG